MAQAPRPGACMQGDRESRGFRGTWVTALGGALACGALLAAATPGERPLDELLEEVREAGDDVDPGVFDEIGAHLDLDGFRTLQQAVVLVIDPDLLQRAYGQFVGFRDTDLELGVVEWLNEHANAGHFSSRRQAATRALCGFGGDALKEMRAILEGNSDQACRQIAIGGLVPMIQAQRTPEALTQFLAWYRVGISGSRETALRTIGVFRSKECLKVLERALGDKATSAQTKALVLGALGAMESERAIELVEAELDSNHPMVSLAAIRALTQAGLRGHEHVLRRLERSREPAVRREALIAQSAFAAGEAWERRVNAALHSRDHALRMGAAIALERIGSVAAMEALHGLLDDPSHLVRAEVIECVARLRRPDSVALLVDNLAGETMRLQRRTCEILVGLTGLELGLNARRWQSWWAAEGESFELPSPEELAAARERRTRRQSLENRTVAAFYGISIDSDRLCFVLDVSGSMEGDRLTLLREEMTRTLERFDDGGRFNVILFSDQVRKWKGKLVEMDERSRASARRTIRGMRAGGGTALFDGLEEGLEDVEVDTIILLSDGMPSVGRIQGTEQILDEINRRNALRRVVIHTVSVGGSSGLLRRLAEASGGAYREVR